MSGQATTGAVIHNIVVTARLGLDGQMDGLVNTDELISDADFLPGSHMSGNTAGKDAPELLSDMSGALCIST